MDVFEFRSRLVEDYARYTRTRAVLDTTEEEAAEDGPGWSIDRPTAEKVGAIVGRGLQEIHTIQVDSKVAAFGDLLRRLSESKKPTTRICVLTDFVATCYYVAAEIEGRGLAHQALNGGMGSDDRLRSLATFSATGEILVATRAVMAEGIDLSHVTDLVLYDVPSNSVALQKVLGRFDRFGRQTQLNVHVLVPPNGTDSLDSESLGLLRELVGAPVEPA